ncbi:uncharacterized protein (DUF1800 family) [Filimonas zeae]|uniref:DUF1800 domain-containing protein n=1 Tax=Filimonas zeae TaxID=1737353 RepID=A0A917ISM4_9BACT|nr:DUF1800 domain-containing protein [Filimonas zeae]MDR6338271.1 uncharacterized protein (DUF1800 family) [Filimonas zeae]GGH62581.1 hypothetical protein GCM10011379_12660 [Filimonas zeae]
MKKLLRIAVVTGSCCVFLAILSSFIAGARFSSLRFPWRKAGLTEEQAAAHLLSRFTYGATPGQVEAVVKQGLEKWFEQQLEARLPDDSLQVLLQGNEALTLSNTEIVNTYPRNAQVQRMAIQDGFINKDSVNKGDQKAYRDMLQQYMQQKGLKPVQELTRLFINQKVLRAAYTQNQLQEVLTSFWFNHFNVSFTKNDCEQYIPVYEREVIRPHALSRFEELLLATAKSPAMLTYLDNFNSTGAKEMPNGKGGKKKAGGLNENYAREVMELHTLGVDGGYTQQDVTEAARVLTGWTLYPMNDYYNKANRERLESANPAALERRGVVHTGDFLFQPNRHDMGTKTVLGKQFAANGGYEEGVELLHMLAHHASTATFISRKLAVKFVSDNPPQSLIDKMAKTFIDKKGDIKQVLITMVNAPEFWSSDALREKTKSPFELAISAVRGLDARIHQPYQLYTWISRMGERIYYYQAPTGFPDKGTYWINTGSLLNRMNFGLALASGRVPGVSFNLLALNNNHEPESAEAALATYCRLLMPERNSEATIQRLTPLLNDPRLQQKIDKAAAKNTMQQPDRETPETIQPGYAAQRSKAAATAMAPANKYQLSQVVGIIIGSPEFQRR